MKTILGLDLGTNSIGWALVKENFDKKQGEILGIGTRIIPMDAAMLGDFEKGNKVSQTADRTRFRGVRRLRERELLRRERLHRVLNIIGFLPKHYSAQIDFEKHFGQFKEGAEPKLNYLPKELGKKADFIFKNSYSQMLADFAIHQPELVGNNRKVPYDWTIYFLRKKALTQKIEKEELAWLLLNFNQKRGYFQLRGEEDETTENRKKEFFSLLVTKVEATDDKKDKSEIWYSVHLENGWIYRRSSKTPLDWTGKVKEFIVTTEIDENGIVKKDKEGKEKRSFSAPKEEDWTLLKKKTEFDIDKSKKTVGTYIYETLLKSPNQKIKGKLVRVIERNFYKAELQQILEKQKEFHNELKSEKLYLECIEELYPNNETHFKNIEKRDFSYLFLNDIIFYQRPLKTKKSLIANCQYESRFFVNKETNAVQEQSIKCIAKSHPLFQEFRLWQFIHNLKIYEKEKVIDGKLFAEYDVTNIFLNNEDEKSKLFDWLNDRKEIDQKALLKYPGFKLKKDSERFRWNYVEDKIYPCNKTRNSILNKFEKNSKAILTQENEIKIWHLLYSVNTKEEIDKALKNSNKRASKENMFNFLIANNFTLIEIESLKKIRITETDYGSYSEKAIKKMLPLMRIGKHWKEDNIAIDVKNRIIAVTDRLKSVDFNEAKIENITDDDIPKQVLKSFIKTKDSNPLKGLNTYQVCYAVYGRHSESRDSLKWNSPYEIHSYLKKDFIQNSLRNPIVEQIIKETLKVVADIWKQYGNGVENFFDEIHIELGREMKNPADKRKSMNDQITANENTNLRIKALIAELKNDINFENIRPYSPSQQEILKIYEDGVLKSNIVIPVDIEKILKTPQPTKSELTRYKLWLEQKYRSPYTGEPIPLNKLFTSAFEIEHIIPQSRYFDDSLSNKVICESEVNKDKDKNTGFEYISNNNGKIVELSFGKKAKLFTVEEYEKFVKENFSKNKSKMKKLLMPDIPDGFVDRQLNDTRYISKVVKNLLSNIVRESSEDAITSKNVVACNGSITSTLKRDWGLNDVWNEIITPRFERMNLLTNSNNFGEWTNKEGKKVFQTTVPIELSKGFNKKRIDHRHHALDALVIACASRSHINFLNNEYAKAKQSDLRFDLRKKLCEKVFDSKTPQNYRWVFYKPWDKITEQSREKLKTTIVSFKQNLRVINKTVNYTKQWKKDVNGKPVEMELVKQSKGENWAVRKPMHKETVKAQVNLKIKKSVQLSVAIDNYSMIVNKDLKKKIIELNKLGFDKNKITKYFKDKSDIWTENEITNIEIYYFDNDYVASRTTLDESFNKKVIESVTDTGIQKILLNHLNQEKYQNRRDEMGKEILPELLAFSQEGIEEMNKNIALLNEGKLHQPIIKVRTYEALGNKFPIGISGNKMDKFVEAAKGTNLFFAIYINESGNRSYDSISLNEVIENQKQGNVSAREIKIDGKTKQVSKLLFTLSPNDLVYILTEADKKNMGVLDFKRLYFEQIQRIYKIVSFTGNRVYAVPYFVAKSIVDKGEFSQLNKMEFSLDKDSIKDNCIKLQVDRLGNIKPV